MRSVAALSTFKARGSIFSSGVSFDLESAFCCWADTMQPTSKASITTRGKSNRFITPSFPSATSWARLVSTSMPNFLTQERHALGTGQTQKSGGLRVCPRETRANRVTCCSHRKLEPFSTDDEDGKELRSPDELHRNQSQNLGFN